MRYLVALFLLVISGFACAQSTARPRPPGTAPLEEPAAPAAEEKAKAALEQQTVSTRREGTNTITEHRIRGKLFMMRVQPDKGVAYVLIDHRGDGTFSRQDGLDTGVRVPQWILLEF